MIKDDRMETISIKYEWDAYGIEPLIDKSANIRLTI